MPNGKQGNTGNTKNAQKRNISTRKQRVEIIELATSKEGSKGRLNIFGYYGSVFPVTVSHICCHALMRVEAAIMLTQP